MENRWQRRLYYYTNLYRHRAIGVGVKHQLSYAVEIRRGMRQVCILPLLFNLYSEEIFFKKEILEQSDEEITGNGKVITNMRYADDSLLPTSTQQ